MKGLNIALVVMAVAFLGNSVFGQEADGIPKEIIKELDSLVGTWAIEGKVGGKGQTGSCTIRWVRAEDKKECCLMGRGVYKTDGKTKTCVSLLGWNAANKCIEDRGFDTDGGSAILSWTVTSPGKWRGVMRFVENGQEVTSKGHLIIKGPSEFITESESETGDVARFVFTRAKEEKRQKPKL